MTDQTKPVSGQGTVPVPAPPAAENIDEMSDNQALKLLTRLMLAERQDALIERQERARAIAEKNKQRIINAEYVIKEKNNIQNICTHKKGGRGIKGHRVDYAVYYHTFTDQSAYIRCQICGMKWRKQDTSEFLVRSGKKVPNHTGIGWDRAMQMFGESTNKASASEISTAAQNLQTDVGGLE